ncbi:hypothetical protein C0995_006642 [Termitomyces sp. Mi166|nr:hypothetical protein C0995_006642 [Termitomyces sp. Mi166\
MHFSTALFLTVALILPAFAECNSLINDVKSSGESKGEYIVTFKSNNRPSCITHNNTNVIYDYTIINGVAGLTLPNKGRFTNDEIKELQASPDVEGVYQDHDGGFEVDIYVVDSAGTTYGVAKLANIVAVKVIGQKIIYGLEWVHQQTQITGHPSVVNLAIGAEGIYEPLDEAVINVAAGNFAMDVKYFSPAHVPDAITVAASNIADQQTWWSNYGPAVDIFAGGEYIVTTQTNSTTATTIKSGTSMSTAYVTGLVATFLTTGKHTPAEVKKFLNDCALSNVLEYVSKEKFKPKTHQTYLQQMGLLTNFLINLIQE